MDYPHQFDVVWLASDNQGRVAAMVTAGEGPIPEAVLAGLTEEVDLERLILALPCIAEATLLEKMPDPASFLDLCSRGLLVYDWSDVHRSLKNCTGHYQLMATPSVNLDLESLPTDLRTTAEQGRVEVPLGDQSVAIG